MSKVRLDVYLVEKKLAETRSKAQALIMAGAVIVDDEPAIKAGQLISSEAVVRVKQKEHPYVSRSANKLKAALLEFKINPKNQIALDVGASTGGFTEILLEFGTTKVFALDVGHSQLDWKIRSHPNVVVIEKVNARTIKYDIISHKVDIIVIDVSFISLKLILENLKQFSIPDKTNWVALVKPQFEVGREKVGKGGLVLDVDDQLNCVSGVRQFAENIGLKYMNLLKSPIKGTDGNQEYLIHFTS